PTYYPSTTHLDSAIAISLQPGERHEQVDIKLAKAPYYCVDGKLQLSSDPATSVFTIHDVALAWTTLVRVRSTAAADHTFQVCGLTSGSYRLTSSSGSVDFNVADTDLHSIHLSPETAQLRLQADWDGTPPATELKLDATELDYLRQLAEFLGTPDATS